MLSGAFLTFVIVTGVFTMARLPEMQRGQRQALRPGVRGGCCWMTSTVKSFKWNTSRIADAAAPRTALAREPCITLVALGGRPPRLQGHGLPRGCLAPGPVLVSPFTS